MDKESIIALQKIDCNCNDCKFMVRNIEKYKESEILHHKWQFDYFNETKEKLIAKGEKWIEEGEIKKGETILKEANRMKFVYENTCYINYGFCDKFKKDVSFIPNVCQLHTQECFKHRKDESI